MDIPPLCPHLAGPCPYAARERERRLSAAREELREIHREEIELAEALRSRRALLGEASEAAGDGLPAEPVRVELLRYEFKISREIADELAELDRLRDFLAGMIEEAIKAEVSK